MPQLEKCKKIEKNKGNLPTTDVTYCFEPQIKGKIKKK